MSVRARLRLAVILVSIAAMVVGCTSLLGVDDVRYEAADGGGDDGSPSDAAPDDDSRHQPGPPPSPDASTGDAATSSCSRQALLFADFEQQSTTTAYVSGVATNNALGTGGLNGALVDVEGSGADGGSGLVIDGTDKYVYAEAPSLVKGSGFVEADVVVEPFGTDDGSTVLAVAFKRADAGAFDETSSVHLTASVIKGDGGVRFVLEGHWTSQLTEYEPMTAHPAQGAWVHAKLTLTSEDAGVGAAVTIGGESVSLSRVLPRDERALASWGIGVAATSWRIRIDNACVR